MTTFYLATPYTKYPGGTAKAYSDALWAVTRLVEHGLDVFSPVVHFHPISVRMDDKPHSWWMERCKPFLMAADELLVVKMPGWLDSAGVAEETQLFCRLSRPSMHLSWPITDLDVTLVLARAAGMQAHQCSLHGTTTSPR